MLCNTYLLFRGRVTLTREVAIFSSCFNDALFPRSIEAAIKVLGSVGVIPSFSCEQTCCGQMHFNTGYASMALPMVRKFVDTYRDSDAVITISGSCTAMIREQFPKLAQRTRDVGFIKETSQVVSKVYEFTEYLTSNLNLDRIDGYYPHRVTYHPTCHSLRSLGIYESAISLLRGVEGLELVELPNAEQCCGFGGTFAIKNSAVSSAMLSDKMSNIKNTNVETVVALDNSCLMHIGGGLKRGNAGISVKHIAEILALGIDGRGTRL